MDFRDVLRVTRKFWLFITVVTIAGGFAGIAYSMRVPASYLATAELQVAPSQFDLPLDLLTGSEQRAAEAAAQIYAWTISPGNPVFEKMANFQSEFSNDSESPVSLNISSISGTKEIVISSQSNSATSAVNGANTLADFLVETVNASRIFEVIQDDSKDLIENIPLKLLVTQEALVTNPSIPINQSIILAIGMMAGLFASLAISVVLEIINRKIYSSRDVQDLSSIPVLSDLVEKSKDDTEDRFRKLRTFLNYSFQSKAGTLILLSSVDHFSDTKLLARNLANSFAKTSLKTHVLDLDFQRGRNEKQKQENNLGDFILGKIQFQELVDNPSNSNPLYISSGEININPSDYFTSNEFKLMIESFRSSADVSICIAPSVRSGSDALVLSSQINGVVLCVSQGKTSFSELKSALNNLEILKSENVLVLLTNDSESNHSPKKNKL